MVSQTRIRDGEAGRDTLRSNVELLAAPCIYLIATLLANYTATWFVPFPVFGMVAVGTLIFGITFTQRDRVHQQGRRKVYLMIAIAAVMNMVMAWLLGVPGQIILASFTAIVLAELVDTEIYHRYLARPWIERVIRSNMISIPLDSILFNAIAFAGMFAWPMWVAIVFGEVVVKSFSSLVAGGVQWKNMS